MFMNRPKCFKILFSSSSFLFLLFIFSLLLGCVSQKTYYYDKQLGYQEFRNNQKIFFSSDGQLRYVDQGEGKVILLLHGVPSSSWLYREMIFGLVDGGYRVIAPDMLGFGSSENPDGYQIYSSMEHAKRIIELMDSLQIDNWVHVMHDAGGLWTWEIFKKDPSRIEKLILLNTIIYEEGFNPPIRMDAGNFSEFSMWLYSNSLTTDMLLNQLFRKGLKENSLSFEEIEGYKTPLVEGKTRGMYYFFTQTCNSLPDYSSVINSINIPVSVIWGEHDEMLMWGPQKEKVIDSLNIKSEDIHVMDAKHFIQEEMPDKVNSIILDFITR
jgi:haloalkane dehalogenase